MRPVFRPDPIGRPGAYQTYEAAARTRSATCREVECKSRERGWKTRGDVGTPLGRRQANYIRLKAGRRFTVTEQGNKVIFTFGPGQECFARHTLPVGALYTKRGGNVWATPSGAREMREADWIDDQQNEMDRIRTLRERG